MSTIQSSGPGGVTKRYGPLGLGGVAGETTSTNGQFRLVYEFGPGELAAAKTYKFKLPKGYGAVKDVNVEVETAFGAGTIDVHIDATTILTAPIAMTSVGYKTGGMTAGQKALTASSEITIVSAAVTGTAGYAKVAITLERV